MIKGSVVGNNARDADQNGSGPELGLRPRTPLGDLRPSDPLIFLHPEINNGYVTGNMKWVS